MRHCEEPDIEENSMYGMTYQGAVRTLLAPEIADLLKVEEIYTYLHTFEGDATSRSFLTCQNIEKPQFHYSKSSDIELLVQAIEQSMANIIMVVWEHTHFPQIIHKLTGHLIDYNKELTKFMKQFPINHKKSKKRKIHRKDLANIKFSEKKLVVQHGLILKAHMYR